MHNSYAHTHHSERKLRCTGSACMHAMRSNHSADPLPITYDMYLRVMPGNICVILIWSARVCVCAMWGCVVARPENSGSIFRAEFSTSFIGKLAAIFAVNRSGWICVKICLMVVMRWSVRFHFLFVCGRRFYIGKMDGEWNLGNRLRFGLFTSSNELDIHHYFIICITAFF